MARDGAEVDAVIWWQAQKAGSLGDNMAAADHHARGQSLRLSIQAEPA
jgi:hypothetical protein